MLTKAQVELQISNDLGSDLAMRAACELVLEYITGKDQDVIQYIHYEDLRVVTGYQYNESQLLKAAKYLCSFGLLTLGFEYIDVLDDDKSYLLENLDLSEAEEDGYLTHPGNGRQRIKNYKEHVFYFFAPTDLARAL